jgi:hypothetical protein
MATSTTIDFNFFLDEVVIKIIKIAGEMIDETLKIGEKLTLHSDIKFDKDDLRVLEQLKKEVQIIVRRVLSVLIDIQNLFQTIGIDHSLSTRDEKELSRPTTPHLFSFICKIFSNKTSEKDSKEESKNLTFILPIPFEEIF